MIEGELFSANSHKTSGDDGLEISFEFFPPKANTSEQDFWEVLQQLSLLNPRFVSVTYGAGGSTRARTQEVAARINHSTPLEAAAHLTCVGASREEIDEIARSFWASGIRHIVALRGDAGRPGAPFQPHPNGYRCAAELVEGLKRIAPFEISVACHPEVHPDAQNRDADLDNLWRKIDAGADRALSQFFFSSDAFLRFRDDAASRGINTELVPGILPIGNVAQTRKFAALCGSTIPPQIDRLIDGLDTQKEVRPLVSAVIAADLCNRLKRAGVRQFHFYTLNRSELSQAICHLLGLRTAMERGNRELA